MLSKHYTNAIEGMLYFYGIIPLNDILIISCKCGLCDPSDYKNCLDIIIYNIVNKRKAYFFNDKLCHRFLKERDNVYEMQEYSSIAAYKLFTSDDYINAGSEEILFTDSMMALERYLKSIASNFHSLNIKDEVKRIWIDLNNAMDLFYITEKCIENLKLPFVKGKNEFYGLMKEINKMANNIPRWFCKGYTYPETISCYNSVY